MTLWFHRVDLVAIVRVLILTCNKSFKVKICRNFIDVKLRTFFKFFIDHYCLLYYKYRTMNLSMPLNYNSLKIFVKLTQTKIFSKVHSHQRKWFQRTQENYAREDEKQIERKRREENSWHHLENWILIHLYI